MTTRTELRTTVRAELNDSGGTQLWADSLLNTYLGDAIDEYSSRFPREKTQTLTTVADQEEYSLATDTLRVVRVEHPEGFFRVENRLAGGDILDPFLLSSSETPRAVATQLSWDVWGPIGAQTLALRPAPSASGEDVVVRYLASWAKPSADGDTLSTPSIHDRGLVLYVAMRALQWVDTDEAKRQRFERQRGISAGSTAAQYRAELERIWAQLGRRVVSQRLTVRES